MADVTFVIPIAPYHNDTAQHAIWSAQAQTVPCEIVTVKDTERRGAGWTRNTGLAQVNTPFTIFLDADDTVERTFVEQCLKAWIPGHYVYTDWFEGDKRVSAPDCAWVNSTWHTVTTLIPTAYVRMVGGFDETLSGGEDTDFYLKLNTRGYCGRKLALPLFHYSTDGRRGHEFVHGADYKRVMTLFTETYGGKQMSCCGGGNTAPIPDTPQGDQQPGDVLAMAVWAGNRQERGRVTGRLYPRAGNNKLVWVAKLDLEARPDLWRAVADEPETELPNGVDLIADYWRVPPPMAPTPVQPAKRANTTPDFDKLIGAFEPEMTLSNQEINALREGHTVEVNSKGVKINRKHAPDIVTTKRRRK